MSGRVAYSICMVLGIAVAFAIRPKSNLPFRQRAAVWIGALFGAAIGAKLPFVLQGGGLFVGEGKTLLGGLAGGYLGVEIFKLLGGIREKTGDGLVVPLAAAISIGRWGCVFNGCCGAPWVPILESAFHATMLVILIRLRTRESLKWQLLKLYIISYCAFRFLTEFIRHEPRVAIGLTGYQFAAVGLAVVMAVLWKVDERAKSRLPSAA